MHRFILLLLLGLAASVAPSGDVRAARGVRPCRPPASPHTCRPTPTCHDTPPPKQANPRGNGKMKRCIKTPPICFISQG